MAESYSKEKEEILELIKKLEKNYEEMDKQNQAQLCHKKKCQEIKTLCQKGPVYAVEDRYGDVRYGKLIVRNEYLLVTTFQLEKPEDATLLNFSELLSRLNHGSSELPKMGFLLDTSDLEYHFLADRPIYSDNFIWLCSCLKGSSFKGRTMRKFIYDGSSYYQMSLGPPLQENVYANGPKWDWNSWFKILLEYPSYKVGHSVAGLQGPTVRDILTREHYSNYSIKECGLVVANVGKS